MVRPERGWWAVIGQKLSCMDCGGKLTVSQNNQQRESEVLYPLPGDTRHEMREKGGKELRRCADTTRCYSLYASEHMHQKAPFPAA